MLRIGKWAPRPQDESKLTADDIDLMRSGLDVAPEAVLRLPSGQTITGAEMQRWLDATP